MISRNMRVFLEAVEARLNPWHALHGAGCNRTSDTPRALRRRKLIAMIDSRSGAQGGGYMITEAGRSLLASMKEKEEMAAKKKAAKKAAKKTTAKTAAKRPAKAKAKPKAEVTGGDEEE